MHVARDGRPWLVDPAAYGGHREVDLAMLALFGPPRPGRWRPTTRPSRWPTAGGSACELWQLEPLLTHAVMFGGGYGDAALAVLRRFA